MKERIFQPKNSALDAAEKGVTDQQQNTSIHELTARSRMPLLGSIIENTPVVLWAVDRNGKLLLCEGKGLEAFGYKSHDLVGRSLLEAHKSAPFLEEDLQRSLRGEFFYSTKQTKMGGKHIAFENWQGPLHGPDGEISGVAGLAIDITRRQKAEDDWRAEQQYMERLIDSHERDRRLTAYEIHDGLVQDATGAQMHLETLLRTEHDLSEHARSEIGICQELVQKTIIEARHLISGLRPPILDELGLVPAIRHLVNSHNEGGQNIVLDTEPAGGRYVPLFEGAVYRIAQEAIANAVRHSRSDRVHVSLKQKNDQLELEVLDFGVGFEPSNIEETRFGIQGMRERVRLLGGQLEIDSSPGKGTRVFVTMPITTGPITTGSEVGGNSNRPE